MDTRTYLEELDDEFTLDDVGSTLLEDLAKGLYQAEEVIREYIQNAIDAHRMWMHETDSPPEGPIQVELRGTSISIYDYGIGMGETEIRRVKSIALSSKRDSDASLTGHKGVGVWAGLSSFEVMRLYTTKKGCGKAYELSLKFQEIVKSIKENVSLGKVLNPNYNISVYEESEDEHFTVVTLENPVADKSSWFLNEEHIQDAVRRICPCPIDPDFVFEDKITDWYKGHDFQTFEIEVNGEPVYRSYPNTVVNFESGNISIDDKNVAYFWRAINRKNRVLKVKDHQMAGFRIIQDGFTLGEDNLYGKMRLAGYDDLTKGAVGYLDWYVGEIHVVLSDLRPDLPRRKFEEGELARQFVHRIRRWYTDLDYLTRLVSQIRNLKKKYVDNETALNGYVPNAFNLDAAALDTIHAIQAELQKQEADVNKVKGKRNVSYKIAALRDKEIRKLRKELLKTIKDLTKNVPKTNPDQSPLTTIVDAHKKDGANPNASVQEGNSSDISRTVKNVKTPSKKTSPTEQPTEDTVESDELPISVPLFSFDDEDEREGQYLLDILI
ncbi:MAG: ATP-binding protein, partial [Bacteroidota bacterium]